MNQSAFKVGTRLTIVAGLAVGVAACQTTNREAGIAVGAVAGAVAGSFVGDGAGRIVATALGGAIGAWIGGELGGLLDEQEQRRLANATASSALSGEPSHWTNPDNGTTITTKVKSTEKQRNTVTVPLKKEKVKEMPPFEMIGLQYEVTRNSNVRGGPSTDYVIVDRLTAGSTVDVLGKVEGRNWYILAEDGAASGFIHENLVRLVENSEPVLLANADSAAPDVILATTSQTTVCREVEQSVVLKDGTEETETVRACQGEDGGWEIENVA